MSKKFNWASATILSCIILIAANLRAPITAVGPVVPEMIQQLHLTPAMVGLITATPLICFSLFSTFMPRFSNILGLEKLLLYSLLLLATGILIRSAGNVFFLFAGSVLIGISIAIGNVLMPAYIKKRFPDKTGLVTGVYLVAMNLTSALAVGYSINLGKIGNLGWQGSIGIWGIPVLFTFLCWLPLVKKNESPQTQPDYKIIRAVWKSRLAWQISIFLGLQSIIFYVFAAWLPTILQSWGMEAGKAGWLLSYVQMGQVPMMLIGPLLADKMKNQTTLIWITFILLLAGLLMFLILKTEYVTVAAFLIGISVGLAFALATIFFILRTKTVEESAALSGMAQSVGYFEAAIGPPLFGVLYSWTNSWNLSFIFLIIITISLLLSGLYAARNRYVLEEHNTLQKMTFKHRR